MFSRQRAKVLYREIKKFGLEEEMLDIFDEYITINNELNNCSKRLYEKLENKTFDIDDELAVKLLNENPYIELRLREYQAKKIDTQNDIGNLISKISNKMLNEERSKIFDKLFKVNKFELNENQVIQLLLIYFTNGEFLKYLSKRIMRR